MSVTTIPQSVKFRLWGKAAGRCQYSGCNKQLYLDILTSVQLNTAYIAHIYGDSVGGPRFSKEHSLRLKKDISNLMLMCDEHHRLIDKEQVEEHSVERLIQMKLAHEARIEILTSIDQSKKSHVILFGANIGKHHVSLNYNQAITAMNPDRYPEHSNPIELSLKNSIHNDDQDSYWLIQDEQIKESFRRNVASLKGNHKIQHFSLFALAPIPLLIRLGSLFSDLYDVDVYQLHREPCSWKWQDDTNEHIFLIKPPTNFDGIPVLKISLSGSISNERIEKVIEGTCSIWELTINDPHNDFLKTKKILSEFRKSARKILSEINKIHSNNDFLHVFPAMPISAALDFGRIWMAKADMPFIVYDQCRNKNQFIQTLKFN